jgi:hypothetical protein
MMKIPGWHGARKVGVAEGRRVTPTIVSTETEILIFNLATDISN